jgi:hypothetical protein
MLLLLLFVLPKVKELLRQILHLGRQLLRLTLHLARQLLRLILHLARRRHRPCGWEDDGATARGGTRSAAARGGAGRRGGAWRSRGRGGGREAMQTGSAGEIRMPPHGGGREARVRSDRRRGGACGAREAAEGRRSPAPRVL